MTDRHIPEGTPFQRLVWSEIAKIPKGSVITYKQLAERVGKPRAYRAVAAACGANPTPGPIPCHRVIASDGSIGGYSGPGGIVAKRQLLEAEGVHIPQNRV
ncbi:MGMT family protein [bacterium]|nr:MGMT family protein [bacterium]